MKKLKSLNKFLNESTGLKAFRINNQKENHRSKAISIFPGLNSHVMETLAEMSLSIDSLDEIRDIVSRHDRVCLELLGRIEKQDTHNPSTAITFLIIDDAIRNLQTRRRLLKDLMDKKGIILLPLPPHLSNFLLRITPEDMIFFSDGAPPHLKHSHYDDIDFISLPEILGRTDHVDLLVTEGYIENQEIFIRRNVTNIIYNLSSSGLREIFIHNMPHIPPHSEFMKFEKNNINVRISMV